MDRRILIALWLASPACTASPSHLEQVSKRNEAVAAAFGERDEPSKAPDSQAEAPVVLPLPLAPALSRHDVTLAAAPAGIDEALWRDIGWFPADTTDISGFVDRESQSLARWAESTIGERFPACNPLFGSIERTYMMQQADRDTATNVFYGAMTRAQERACMQVALAAFEVTGEQRGDLTIISNHDGPAVRLAWFAREQGTVAILEGSAPLEGWVKPVGTLVDQPALVRLVAMADHSRGMWSVGLRDYGTVFTGLASTGYMMTMTTPAASGEERLLEMTAQLEFESPKAAQQAERGAAAFARDVPGAAELGIVLTVQAEGTWLKTAIKADLNKTDDKAMTAWLQQVLAKIQADVAAKGQGG